jgi:hypothetical protein
VLFGNPLPNELAADESGSAGDHDGLHAVLSLQPRHKKTGTDRRNTFFVGLTPDRKAAMAMRPKIDRFDMATFTGKV